MTEEEWLNGKGLSQLLFHRFNSGDFRKIRLFGVICCRTVGHLAVDPQLMQAVDRAERFADGGLQPSTLVRWRRVAVKRWVEVRNLDPMPADGPISLAVEDVCRPETDGHITWPWARLAQRPQALSLGTPAEIEQQFFPLLRDIFGNPFRPMTFAPEWRSESAVGIAAKMYDSRDFGNMPILADSLQDAGCEHADILSHCREPGTHVRGCWVVDLVLGKT